jgi:RNA:NAD 2'-phosphotransferase (TPT1/KptA family)
MDMLLMNGPCCTAACCTANRAVVQWLHPWCRCCEHDYISSSIHTDGQQRFVLDEAGHPPRLRAAQGHSVQLKAPVLQAITDASSVPCAVHATSKGRCAEGWALPQITSLHAREALLEVNG